MTGSLWLLNAAVAALGILVVVAPIAVVVLVSFSSGAVFAFPPPGLSLRWHAQVFALPQLTAAFVNSLELAALSSSLATLLAALAAFRLQGENGIAARVMRNLVTAPLVFPSIVFGLAALVWIRMLGIGVFGGLVVAHVTLGIPYAFRLVSAQLQTFDPHLEEASRGLGVDPLRTLARVTLPLIWPGIAAGWLFAFIVSLGELNTAIFLTTPQLRTLPIELYGYLQFEGNELVVAAASTLQLALVIALGGLLQLAVAARSERSGR